MSDHDALLAGVLAHPDADLPRLVYADFVEEAGDAAQAEFIRVQCALAGGHFEDEREKAALELRERYLRETHAAEWLAPLKKKGEPLFTPRSHGLFRRGFVECVWMPAAWFVAKAEKLFARCPVNELRVTMGTPTDFAKLVNSPCLRKLKTLDASSHHLGNLGLLSLYHASLKSQLRGLGQLRLRSCNIGGENSTDLLRDFCSFEPTVLDLTGNQFSREEIDLLREWYGEALICDEPK